MAYINGKDILFSSNISLIDGGSIDTSQFATKAEVNELDDALKAHREQYEARVEGIDSVVGFQAERIAELENGKQDTLTDEDINRIAQRAIELLPNGDEVSY